MQGVQWRENPAGFSRTLQIIVAAMAIGCSLFLAVVLLAGSQREGTANVPYFVYIAIGAAGLFMRGIVPTILVATVRQKIVSEISPTTLAEEIENKLAALMMTKTIVGAALVEGVTFLLLVLCLVERSTVGLACASFLIAVILLPFPTQSTIAAWIDGQRRQIAEERAFGQNHQD